MLNDLLLQDEKIVNSTRLSVLGDESFWIGIVLIVASVVAFGLVSVLVPDYDYSFSQLFGFVGVGLGGFFFGLPALSTTMEIAGLIYLLYAEFKTYFKEYAVTNFRVIIRSGAIRKNTDIILPNKIGDVSVEIGIINRLLHLGRIVIRQDDPSRSSITLNGLKEPYKFQADVLKLINRQSYQNRNGSK
jgi:Bacterial membrane flanked domain.